MNGHFVEMTKLLVLCLLVAELDTRAAKLAELVSDHVIRHLDRYVILAIVDHESKPDKRGNDGAAPGLCPNRRPLLQGLCERGRKRDDVWTLPDGSLEENSGRLHRSLSLIVLTLSTRQKNRRQMNKIEGEWNSRIRRKYEHHHARRVFAPPFLFLSRSSTYRLAIALARALTLRCDSTRRTSHTGQTCRS